MSVLIRLWCLLYVAWIAEGTIIYSAQCRSRCHSIYKTPKDHQKLLQCLSPCDKDYSKLGSCRNFCKNSGADSAPCHFSCKILKDVYRNDYGKGPCSSKKFSEHRFCNRNIRCDELRKCCSITNTCEDLVVHGEEVKAVVADRDVTSSSVLARWQLSNITNAVYIIQIREVNSRSIHYTEDNWLDWKQLRQGVDVAGIKVNGLPSGVRLQLRVAIVNSSGLQSIGPPTRVIRTLFNASNPSGPEQIWIMKKTYYKNLVNVTIVWNPPAVLDVPVHSYRIYWKKLPLLTADYAVQIKKRTRVAGTQYNYTIQNLKPDTIYNIEIEAICLWRKKRLKSPKVAFNISTGHIKAYGKESVDVYFFKDKTKKSKKDNYPPYYDENIKNLDVLVERQSTTTTTPRQGETKSVFNTARQRQPNLWITLCLIALTFFLFSFQTN